MTTLKVPLRSRVPALERPLRDPLQSRFGGSGPINLLDDAAFTDDSTGTGSATFSGGTLTLDGDTTTNRGVANFDVSGLTPGSSYTISFTVLADVDGAQAVNLVLDANKIVGSATTIQLNIAEGEGAVSYAFTADAIRPFLQFYTGSGTGEWVATDLLLVPA